MVFEFYYAKNYGKIFIKMKESLMNKDYKLIFYENFDNLDNWNFNIGSGVKNLWGNHEKEFYTNRKKIFI